jgi:protein involved in polysaccharide export with SLBB domain
MQTQILANAASSAATALNAEEASFTKAELTLNQSMLSNLSALQEKSEGRVALNITGNIDEWAGSKDDLILQDGDSLLVPKKPQEVLIIGEVYSPGAQVFLPDMSVKDYIERTGGATRYADSDQIFVVQANGFAYGSDSPNVGDIEKAKLKAGDAIFVPQKLERYATTRTTKDIIDILFKTAVVIATITILF